MPLPLGRSGRTIVGGLVAWAGFVVAIMTAPPDPPLAIARFFSPAFAAPSGIAAMLLFSAWQTPDRGLRVWLIVAACFAAGLPLIWLWSELVQMRG